MTILPPEARRVLEEGILCYVAAADEAGPHLTPIVYALDGGRLWATTARGSRKARLWRRDPSASGLVRAGPATLTFRGRVTAYDALDPRTWARSVLRSPVLARASTRFALRNVRFFAGYARDAHRVPLAWTPPGRILVSIDLEEAAILDAAAGTVASSWGEFGRRAASRSGYRALPSRGLPDDGAPEDVRRIVRESGEGALAVAGGTGVTVLPVRWLRDPEEGAYYAALPVPLLALAGTGPSFRSGLVADHSSAWRAARMAGLLLRGPAEAYVPSRLRSGRATLVRRTERLGLGEDDAVVRVRPERAAWWKGWASGTVVRP